MRFDMLALALVALSGCGTEGTRKQALVTTAPPVVTSEQTTHVAPEVESDQVDCTGPPTPASFLCHQEEVCAGLDGKGPLDLFAFLCLVAATPASTDKSLSMAEITTRLPYPKHLKPLHNRQEFLRRRGKSYPFRDQHSAVCKRLRSDLLETRD